MNIQLNQLFWCSPGVLLVLTHCHMYKCLSLSLFSSVVKLRSRSSAGSPFLKESLRATLWGVEGVSFRSSHWGTWQWTYRLLVVFAIDCYWPRILSHSHIASKITSNCSSDSSTSAACPLQILARPTRCCRRCARPSWKTRSETVMGNHGVYKRFHIAVFFDRDHLQLKLLNFYEFLIFTIQDEVFL